MNQPKRITASVLYSCLLPCLHRLFFMQEFSPGHSAIHTEWSIVTIAHQCVSQLILWTNCLMCWFKRQDAYNLHLPYAMQLLYPRKTDCVISQTSPMVWCRWNGESLDWAAITWSILSPSSLVRKGTIFWLTKKQASVTPDSVLRTLSWLETHHRLLRELSLDVRLPEQNRCFISYRSVPKSLLLSH